MADLAAVHKKVEDARERSAWMALIHPHTGEIIGADEGKPVRFRLKSRDCKAYRDAEHAWEAKRALMRANSGAFTMRDWTDYEAHQTQQLIGLVVEWENVEEAGAALACTRENISKQLDIDWVRDQVYAFTSDLSKRADDEIAPQGVVEDVEKKSSTGAVGASP